MTGLDGKFEALQARCGSAVAAHPADRNDDSAETELEDLVHHFFNVGRGCGGEELGDQLLHGPEKGRGDQARPAGTDETHRDAELQGRFELVRGHAVEIVQPLGALGVECDGVVKQDMREGRVFKEKRDDPPQVVPELAERGGGASGERRITWIRSSRASGV